MSHSQPAAGAEFEGTSNAGDFSEALQKAIAAAKEQLRTDLVSWAVTTIRGVSGGFVLQNDLTVTVHAVAGPAAAPGE